MFKEAYIAEQFSKTPLVNFDSKSGIFELKGKSFPENPLKFYEPMFDWLDAYIQNPAPKTILNVQLDYFDTGSCRCLFELFKKLEKISKSLKEEAIINWFYIIHDEDIRDSGEDFKSLIEIPFNILLLKN